MSSGVLIDGVKIPYCPGCGHRTTTTNLTDALDKLGLRSTDIVVVSDIGCCGIIDSLLRCHTIHGLHGRACVLAVGVAWGLNHRRKKVIAVQGDGGSTIGLQHLLEAARQNVDMTLVVQNNLVYGMTGGQISGLSGVDFKCRKLPDANHAPPYDICELAHRAGAAYSTRVLARSDISDVLAEAVAVEGFSLVEIVGPCPAYGERKLKDIDESCAVEVGLRNERPAIRPAERDGGSAFEGIPRIESMFESRLGTRLGVVLAGSAGEGVQAAAEALAGAGASAGLSATKKGEYPITVGTGFSIAEIILSPEEINYTGIQSPEVVIVTSEDGWEMVNGRLGEESALLIDASIAGVDPARAVVRDFRKAAGRRGAALAAISFWLLQTGLLPIEAMKAACRRHKHAVKMLAAIESAERLSQD